MLNIYWSEIPEEWKTGLIVPIWKRKGGRLTRFGEVPRDHASISYYEVTVS